jgi:hypothetical protein
MIAIVAVLAGTYTLRRYARAVLLYRHGFKLHPRQPDGEPVDKAPAAGRST